MSQNFNQPNNKVNRDGQQLDKIINSNQKLKQNLERSKSNEARPDGGKFSFSNDKIQQNPLNDSTLDRDRIMESIIKQNKQFEDTHLHPTHSSANFLSKFNQFNDRVNDTGFSNQQNKNNKHNNSSVDQEKIIEENKITKKLNEEQQEMIKDLEDKLTYVINNKEQDSSSTSRQASENEINIRLKQELDKRDKQVHDAKGKVEQYMNELQGFMGNMAKVRQHVINMGNFYGDLNKFLNNIKSEMNMYKQRMSTINSNQGHNDISNIMKEMEQLNIHIEEKQIILSEGVDTYQKIHHELDKMIKNVDQKELEHITSNNLFSSKQKDKFRNKQELMDYLIGVRREVKSHNDTLTKVKKTQRIELSNLLSHNLLSQEQTSSDDLENELGILENQIKHLTFEHLIFLDNQITSRNDQEYPQQIQQQQINMSKANKLQYEPQHEHYNQNNNYNNINNNQHSTSNQNQNLETRSNSNLSRQEAIFPNNINPSFNPYPNTANPNINIPTPSIQQQDPHVDTQHGPALTPKGFERDNRIQSRMAEFKNIMSKQDLSTINSNAQPSEEIKNRQSDDKDSVIKNIFQNQLYESPQGANRIY